MLHIRAQAAVKPWQHSSGARRPFANNNRQIRTQYATGVAVYASKLTRVLDRIDDCNKCDPRTTEVNGVQIPYELAYSRWLEQWLKKLEPEPTEEQLIVARGQHIERWQVPRNTYPEGRQGYLNWREDLKKMHAEKVGKIMEEEGYTAAAVEKVKSLIMKKNIRDPDAQVIEDALCLVFLQRQFAEFRLGTDEEKMVDIIKKSWRKMGERGQAAARKLDLPEAEMRLVIRALAE